MAKLLEYERPTEYAAFDNRLVARLDDTSLAEHPARPDRRQHRRRPYGTGQELIPPKPEIEWVNGTSPLRQGHPSTSSPKACQAGAEPDRRKPG